MYNPIFLKKTKTIKTIQNDKINKTILNIAIHIYLPVNKIIINKLRNNIYHIV